MSDYQADFLDGQKGVKTFTASDTGLSAVDCKTQADTAGSVIDVSGRQELGFSIAFVTAGTTPTVGTAVLQATLYDEDGTTPLSGPIDIVTIVSTKAAGTAYYYVGWSAGVGAALQAYGSGGTFTIGSNINALRALRKIKLTWSVTTAYDQTGAKTASVKVVAK